MSYNSQLFEKFLKGDKLNIEEVSQLKQAWEKQEAQQDVLARYLDSGAKSLNFGFPIELIYTEILSADAASLTVPIPAKYKHLIILMGGRTDNAAYQDVIVLRFNADTGSNYLNEGIEGTGSTVTAQANIITDGIDSGNFAGTSSDSSALSGSVIFIPHYSTNVLWKATYRISGGAQRDGTNPGVNQNAGFWKNTNPINQITFSPLVGTVLKSASVFSVYGIL